MPQAKPYEFQVGPFRFRPTLKLTLWTIAALAMLLALGTWQVERLQWKLGLIAERTERVNAPVIAPPQVRSDADLAGVEFRHVTLTGHFLHDREMYLAARSLNDNLGFQVVTPFQGEDGVVTLVDRGWIPLDRKNPATRAEGQLQGTVTIDGLIRKPGRSSWFVPDNQTDQNVWFYVDIPPMAAHAGLANVRPYFVEAGKAPNPGGIPIGGQSRIELPNNHLSYAITWYSLAIALVVIYLIYHRVKPE